MNTRVVQNTCVLSVWTANAPGFREPLAESWSLLVSPPPEPHLNFPLRPAGFLTQSPHIRLRHERKSVAITGSYISLASNSNLVHLKKVSLLLLVAQKNAQTHIHDPFVSRLSAGSDPPATGPVLGCRSTFRGQCSALL